MDNVSVEPRLLPYQLLEEITNNFSDEKKVGKGSYGEVYKGEYTNGKMIAVKVLHYIPGLDDKQFEKEYHNLASLQHKNIVRLVGYCHETRGEFISHNGKNVLAEKTKRALCFEYMQNGSLESFLTDESSGNDWRTRFAIIKGICQGLKYLHEELNPPMYHLDLKPANILLDENMVPKIADFGLSRLFGGEQTQMTKSSIGTHGYVPPEYIDAAVISIKFDIFSLGVVIIKIMTGLKGYFRSAEMSPLQFIELVHVQWKNKLQTTSVYTLELYCKQVKSCLEIALSCVNADRYKRPSIGKIIRKLNETETSVQLLGALMNDRGSSMYKAINFPSKQANKQYDSSGRVQLAIENNIKAPLKQHNKKVMLELTGTAFSGDRLGLDLVVVVDVSGSMHGKKMNQLKTALQFVVWKLSFMDQLSIVIFSDAAMKLCPLRQINKDSQQELQMLINGLKARGDSTNIMDGLLTGLKVLADCEVSSGRVAAVMLMCDGRPDDARGAAQVTIGNLPVYTFGFGMYSDPQVLSTIAANSMGGTFSHVPDIGGSGLTKAFSQCLAGLLTVVVRDLELTVAAAGDESTIVKVTGGNYPQTRNGDSVTISFGYLYSREVRNVIVDLRFAMIDSEHSTEMLKVTYSYSSSSSSGRQHFVAPPEMLTVWRTSVEVLHDEETDRPAGLQMEAARLRTTRMINEAITMADDAHVLLAQRKLVEAQNMLDEQSNPLLRAELQKLLEHLQTLEEYRWRGRMYAFSSRSSHERQRFTARGRDMETMRLFATQRMDEYLEQAKKFHKDPTKPLPSVDDDVEEEVAALLINVASREEEMRRLSLDTED